MKAAENFNPDYAYINSLQKNTSLEEKIESLQKHLENMSLYLYDKGVIAEKIETNV